MAETDTAPPTGEPAVETPPTAERQPQGAAAGTLSGEPLKDLDEGAERADQQRSGPAAVQAAARGQKLSDGEQSEALTWFLGQPIDSEIAAKTLNLNFGSPEHPNWISWTIKPVGIDTMRHIRQRAQNSRVARKTGNIDEFRVNLEIVVAGTSDPDIRAAAAELNRRGEGSLDPVEALRARFQAKPGFIAQIAGEILTLSGFDDEDVQEAEEVAGAKS